VPLAAANDAPMLLTPSSGLTPALTTEISRVLPIGHKVFVLGGSASLSPSIDLQLQAMGYIPIRVAGASRYETATKIANALGNPTTVFEVDGSNFPDALTAGPAAAITHGAVLFTYKSSSVEATTSYLAVHPASVRYAVGGPAAAADPGASTIVGTDRFETSVLVAQAFFYSPSLVGVASGVTFPDALSGGPITALAGGPVILVPPAGNLAGPTQRYLAGVANSVLSAWLFGGPAAVNTAVANEVAQSLVLVPPAS
jgi:putative cell wall-binding protein